MGEAGRRAANAVLDRAGWSGPRATIWPLQEPASFDVWKRLDAALYQHGHPHIFESLRCDKADMAADLLRRTSAIPEFPLLEHQRDEHAVSALLESLPERFGFAKREA